MRQLLLLFSLLLLAAACKREQQQLDTFAAGTGAESAARHLETPRSPRGMTEQIIEHMGYTTSYNADRRQPNWVCYELTPEEARGRQERQGEFQPDPQAKGRSASNADYSRSGYGRGHMAPAGDMKWNSKAMRESFYLSNICPQRGALNAGLWNDLEMGIRSMARGGTTVYIACGPIFTGSKPRTIGSGRVAVPDSFFKVLLRNTGKGYEAIGYIFPNANCKGSVNDYACTVDDVERQTGIDFFPALPDDIEYAVEARSDTGQWRWRTASSENHFQQRGRRRQDREYTFRR
ncbi:MAG: DNA/RNA non-specific endonuclease [Alloprevotella sp.]|nr:DNA/RNA non-specific endonuclease [Alloprevotella sp.]